MRTLHRIVAITIVVPCIAACTGEIGGEDLPSPTLLALSTKSITVGQPLEFIGGDFLNNTKTGHTEIRFEGEFKATSGKTYAVNYLLRPRWSDGNRVLWPFVGPYSNPFVPKDGDQLGEFTGTVTAINVVGNEDNREEAASSPMPVTLKFSPSIIIRDFQPLAATCSEPTKRILGGFNYKISVETVGFTPVNFTYILVGLPNQTVPLVYRHLAMGATDNFGAANELIFAPVPDGQPFYIAGFAVRALGTDGIERKLDLAIGVHRPIEYIDSGEVKIAQIEPAKPDSGCLSGGETNGTTVSYTQTTTETRTRTLGLTWDESWLTSVSNMTGGSTTRTNSVNWQVSHTETEGWTFGWDASTSVTGGAEASVFGLAKASLSTTVQGGIHQDHNWGYTDGRSVGGDYSESDTESWATTNTQSHNVAQGSSDFWAVSSSDSTALQMTGLILPGRFGVFYRQTTRIAIPGSIVAYNLCGQPEVVAQSNFFDYQWSLELAQGPTCSPLPESKLPEAECIMAPCGSP